MKRVLLVTPYNLTRKEVGGAFTYQFCDRLAEHCKVDVILFQYEGDILDKPQKDYVQVVKIEKIKKRDKLLSWFQCPMYHPLFTSRFSWKLVRYIKKVIKEINYDFIVFDYSQTFALSKAIKHPHKLLVAHDVIYQRFEREGSKLTCWIKWTEGKLSDNTEKLYSFSDKDCRLFKDLYGLECDLTPVFIKKDILETEPTECSDYHIFFADWGRVDNSESLEWFLDNIAGGVRHIPFKVIGGRLPDTLKEKLLEYENIEYLGFVDNPYPLIANAKSEICPLHKGAGIKVKCLEALACGTPIIGTQVALEGISDIFSEGVFHAESPKDFMDALTKVSLSLAEKKQLKKFFIENYSQKSIIDYILN